jgi:malonate transporter
MDIAAILAPDFALILLGIFLVRITDWGPSFWLGLEKLVYFVLFPALLFYATSKAPLNFAETGKLLQVAMTVVVLGIALSWLAKPLFRSGPMVFESSMQVGFRFNSYIGLAVAARLGGEEAVSLMALIIGFAVPICNMAAVHALVHKSGGLVKELARNPLLIATVAGTLLNLLGGSVPEVAGSVLTRMGNAAIALGLIAVGAGLRLSGNGPDKGISAYILSVKLLALPGMAFVLGRWVGLSAMQLQIVVMFCALPTASSAYVLAARMGGKGALVSFLVSASTLLSVATLPLWLALVR